MQKETPTAFCCDLVETQKEGQSDQEALPGIKGNRKLMLSWWERTQLDTLWKGSHCLDWKLNSSYICLDIRKLTLKYSALNLKCNMMTMLAVFFFFLWREESVAVQVKSKKHMTSINSYTGIWKPQLKDPDIMVLSSLSWSSPSLSFQCLLDN
jgi:hypothetical protein